MVSALCIVMGVLCACGDKTTFCHPAPGSCELHKRAVAYTNVPFLSLWKQLLVWPWLCAEELWVVLRGEEARLVVVHPVPAPVNLCTVLSCWWILCLASKNMPYIIILSNPGGPFQFGIFCDSNLCTIMTLISKTSFALLSMWQGTWIHSVWVEQWVCWFCEFVSNKWCWIWFCCIWRCLITGHGVQLWGRLAGYGERRSREAL